MKKILLDHGGGGLLSHELTREVLLPVFGNEILNRLDDGAELFFDKSRIAFSTDTYVVDPIFFPGGSIGNLAINGTVNDISMCGGIPEFLSVSFILEEGFYLKDLEKIVFDMGCSAKKAGVKVVTGDTKVLPKGGMDKIFINTSGVGKIPDNVKVSSSLAEIGDSVIISGSIADHGITIMTQREGFSFESDIKSDTCPLNGVIKKIFESGVPVHVLRDPTRGGVGTSLNEIAMKSHVGIKIFEKDLPIKKNVMKVCDLLGFDPMYVANEGKFIIFVPNSYAKKTISIIKKEVVGQDACIIGEVTEKHPGRVLMQTNIGGERILGMLTGEQLPRIC